jgi:endogenous inhibitor of DNA gyrase (YacG/DUF329 family)
MPDTLVITCPECGTPVPLVDAVPEFVTLSPNSCPECSEG